ncbi:MAG: hypothetical protein H6864_07865 [Micavibrio sp.]|nr:hypothetical protein [Micavibrio sp.]
MNMKKIKIKRSIFSGSFFAAFFSFTVLTPSMAHAASMSSWASSLIAAASSAVTSVIGAVVSSVSAAVAALLGTISGFLTTAVSSIISWVSSATGCGSAVSAGTGTVGDVICNVILASNDLPGLISGLAYLMGMVMAVSALVKLKDHVENPNQTPISASLKRFVAGGALFMLPMVTEASETLISGGVTVASADHGVSGSAAASYGLDAMMVALIVDIYGPVSHLLGGFGYLAGLFLTVVGISRLLKTSQDGPSGPSGVGTIMTFVLAGVLFTLDDLMTAFTGSMFGDNDITTYAILSTPIDGGAIDDHVLAIISSILLFMMLVGWISFIRGFFILRDVAEGKGQASMMAAITHIFGGALAVNLGPLMNAVQTTFGLTSVGVLFT